MMSNLRKISLLLAVILALMPLLSFAILPMRVQAQSDSIVPGVNQLCPDGDCPLFDPADLQGRDTKNTINQLLIGVALFMTYIGVPLAILFLVIAGFQFMLGKSETAWINIKTTFIGVIVIILAYTAVAFISSTLTEGDFITDIVESN